MHALILDDSKTIRFFLKELLVPWGYTVTEAPDGKEGLRLLKAGSTPDLVLADWLMPEMNGLEFIKAMRADNAYAGVRVVMITSQNDAAQVQDALDAGANEYLMKPFTREMLEDKLRILGLLK